MDQKLRNKTPRENRPIRVLHVFAPSFKSRFGGQNIFWKYCLLHWNDPDVAHFVLDYEKEQPADAVEVFSFEYPHDQKKTLRWERAFWVFTLFGYLIKFRARYDVLHLHVLWWGGLLVALWSKWVHIPAIYESVLLDFDTPGGILKEKFGRLKVRLLKSFKAILAISEYLAEDYRRAGFSRQQVFTLANCVDVELFSPVSAVNEKILIRQRLNLPINSTILLFVGSVKERKGVDVLIKAFIEASFICSGLYLLIVGPVKKNENPTIDEVFVNDLYLHLKKNNLLGQVSFTGLIQNRQVLAQMYQGSDIFVFPSNNEGLGNVVLEAMACGLPVVVSKLPVLENVIKHGENGLIIPIGDSGALKDSILQLYSDPIYAKKMGRSAKEFVQDLHGFYAWQSQLVEFYKKLL